MHFVSFIILILGGINWLLLGLFKWEIGMLFGDGGNIVSRIIYILFGLAAIYEILTHKKNCTACKSKKPIGMPMNKPEAPTQNTPGE